MSDDRSDDMSDDRSDDRSDDSSDDRSDDRSDEMRLFTSVMQAWFTMKKFTSKLSVHVRLI